MEVDLGVHEQSSTSALPRSKVVEKKDLDALDSKWDKQFVSKSCYLEVLTLLHKNFLSLQSLLPSPLWTYLSFPCLCLDHWASFASSRGCGGKRKTRARKETRPNQSKFHQFWTLPAHPSLLQLVMLLTLTHPPFHTCAREKSLSKSPLRQ